MQIIQSRRNFLASMSAVGGAAAFGSGTSLADEAPLETTTVRLIKIPGICIAPQYVAEELLRAEGFTEVRYVVSEAGRIQAELIASGEADFSLNFAAPLIVAMDAGEPIKVLAGVHPGCFELFVQRARPQRPRSKGQERWRAGLGLEPAPLPGRDRHLRRARPAPGHRLGASVPRSDPWSCSRKARSTRSWAFRPSRRSCAPGASATCSSTAPSIAPGRSISAACSRRMPRSSRSIRWRRSVCCARSSRPRTSASAEPTRVARLMVDGGFAASYDYALQTMGDVPYARWREYDPEDTVRFYALRLHEVGMITSTPQPAHRRGHRLALPQRAQARAEGVRQESPV